MVEPLPDQVQFTPPKAGVGWPYMVLMGIGAVICFYLALDLYMAFAGYARTPPRDYIFVAALAGIGLLFLAAAWGFWYFPWTWAVMTVDATGITLTVRGLGARPRTHIPWDTLVRVEVVILPRAASLVSFHIGRGRKVALRSAALEADLSDVLRSLESYADAQGLRLVGPPLSAPLLGRRRWSVAPRET